MKYPLILLSLPLFAEGSDFSRIPEFPSPERRQEVPVIILTAVQSPSEKVTDGQTHDRRNIAGWVVRVNMKLIGERAADLDKALPLLQAQLEEIVRLVPDRAVAEMQKVPLWINPEYPNKRAGAEYHPGADWLRDNGRDPAMAKGVEFTNVSIFEAETRRMPNFALHELAHAYHDRVLGFGNAEIEAAFRKAKASGKYDQVLRQDSEGRKRLDKAYAMTNAQEYFAECSEAFFARNDFFPFTCGELKQHDPEMLALLEKLWGTASKP